MHRSESSTATPTAATEGVHISESLSQILGTTQHSGLAILQRAAAVVVQQPLSRAHESGNSAEESTMLKKEGTCSVVSECDGSESSRGSATATNHLQAQLGTLTKSSTTNSSVSAASSHTVSLLNNVTTATSSTSGGQRMSLPIIHTGQNGQLLMLMNQSDLVRLASSSALTQMLSISASTSSRTGVGVEPLDSSIGGPISPEPGDTESSTMLMADGSSSDRALRRKSVHNEVEKRRRQKINNWIEKLSSIIPSSSDRQPAVQVISEASQSSSNLSCKADVLQRTYDYVIQISKVNTELTQMIALAQHENEVLRSEVARLGNLINATQQKKDQQSQESQISSAVSSSPTRLSTPIRVEKSGIGLSSTITSTAPVAVSAVPASAVVGGISTSAPSPKSTNSPLSLSASSSPATSSYPSLSQPSLASVLTKATTTSSSTPVVLSATSNNADVIRNVPHATVALCVLPSSIIASNSQSQQMAPTTRPTLSAASILLSSSPPSSSSSSVKRASLPVVSVNLSANNSSSNSPTPPTGSRQNVSVHQSSATTLTVNSGSILSRNHHQAAPSSPRFARKRRGGPIDT